jgi:predicted TIM-barrel fold metal-dependent hydrolase
VKQADNPAFNDGLNMLADADLGLDTANPRMTLLESMQKISDKVPSLRIVLDHLPNFEPTEAERAPYEAILKEFTKRPQVYVKLSAILRRVDSKVPTDVAFYRAKLDLLVATFGEDRIVFGSDWPNSDGVAPIDQVFKIAKDYFASKPRTVAEKYFWKNSVAAYKWVRREPSQPSL